MDLVVLLWLAINTTTLGVTLPDAYADWCVLRAVEAEAPTAPDTRPLLLTAQREFIQDVFVALMALLFDVVGVVALLLAFGPHPGNPLLILIYVTALMVAVSLLSLKQAQKRWMRWRLRRLYRAHPWDR